MKKRWIGLLLVLLAMLCFTLPVQAKSQKGKTAAGKLSAPVIKEVSNVKQGIRIRWKAVKGAAKYRVFYKKGSKWKKIADTASTSFVWTKAVSGREYRFKVRCITAKGKKYTSGYSKGSKSLRYIAAPQISSLVNTLEGVVVSWGAVEGAEQYRLFFRNGSKWQRITDTTSNSFLWTDAQDNIEYTFTVRCLSADGQTYTSAYDKTGNMIRADRFAASFDEPTRTVNLADTGTFSVTSTIQNVLSYRYVSSDPAVIRITPENGFEAFSSGTADVTCTVTLRDGRSASCVCHFTVLRPVRPIGTDFSVEYQNSKFYSALMNVALTGNYRTDIIAIAESQIGYHEGDNAAQLDGSYHGHNDYSEYGRYLGSNGRAWCSEFASWCIRQAGVPLSVIANSRAANVKNFNAPYHTWEETVFAGGTYTPEKGDLILLAKNGKDVNAENLSHTAIVYNVEWAGSVVYITVIHGNNNDSVRKSVYWASADTGMISDGRIVYFVAPDY